MKKTVSRDIDGSDETEIEYAEILIFTSIEDLEATALHKHLERVGGEEKEQTQAEKRKNIRRWEVPCDVSGQKIVVMTKCLQAAGNAVAGIELAHLLHIHTRPKLVVFCGIGGSLDVDEAQLGNVIVSKSIHWRGFDKISGDSISKEMRKKVIGNHEVNDELLNLLKTFARKNNQASRPAASGLFPTTSASGFGQRSEDWLKQAAADPDLQPDIANFSIGDYYDRKKPIVKFGKIMSWDFVLNKKEVRDDVKKYDEDYLAVEMESGGMSLAIKRVREHFRDIPTEMLAIRGISDLCNKKVDDMYRDLAADHAAAFLAGFLKSEYDPGF